MNQPMGDHTHRAANADVEMILVQLVNTDSTVPRRRIAGSRGFIMRMVQQMYRAGTHDRSSTRAIQPNTTIKHIKLTTMYSIMEHY
jgi:hypothetical protein